MVLARVRGVAPAELVFVAGGRTQIGRAPSNSKLSPRARTSALAVANSTGAAHWQSPTARLR
eukprot:10872874-Lingulodinium_polyedra.AAC.1